MGNRIYYVSFHGIIVDTLDFRNNTLEGMRKAYQRFGDSLDEKKFLNSIDWYNMYLRHCKIISDSVNTIGKRNDIVIVNRTFCEAETDAVNKIIGEIKDGQKIITIPLKKDGVGLCVSTKQEQHYADITSDPEFTVSGNVLVEVKQNQPELNIWKVRGGTAVLFDSKGKEIKYLSSDGSVDQYNVKKLSKVPKLFSSSKK